MQARQYGSCTDSFSIFGFLAFLLALLDLVMELQDMDTTDAGARRRREVMDEDADNQTTDQLTCQVSQHSLMPTRLTCSFLSLIVIYLSL